MAPLRLDLGRGALPARKSHAVPTCRRGVFVRASHVKSPVSAEGLVAASAAAAAVPHDDAAPVMMVSPSSSAAAAEATPAAADAIKLSLHVAHVEVDGEAMPKVGGGMHPDMSVPPRALVPSHHPEAHAAVEEGAGAVATVTIETTQQQQQQQQQPQQQQQQPQQQQQQQHHQLQQQQEGGHHQQQQEQQQHHHSSSSSSNLATPHERQPWQRHPRFGKRIELRLSVGDVVWGQVVSSDRQAGARVRVLGHEGVVGFVPAGEGLHARGNGRAAAPRALPLGDVRAFAVRGLPDRATFCGRGPLLSAHEADEALLWRRAAQLHELCRDEHEAVTVTVTGHNAGGLRASLLGLRAFIPFSTLLKGAGEVCDAASMVGRQLSASVVECDRARGALTLSEKAAESARALAALQPGALALGTVASVEPRAAKVRLDGVRAGPLAVLHVSKFSCEFTRNLKDHLAPGDRVVAIVLAPARGHRGAELSTAHLEVAAGDMLKRGGPARVYATADRQAALVRAQMAEAAAAAAEQPWCEPAGAAADEGGAWAEY